MAKQKKPHTAETREEWEARREREQKERDENPDLLVAFAGLNSPAVNEALGLQEYEREANEIEARVEARKERDEAEAERKKREQWEKDQQEREAQGFYDYRQESRGLPTPEEAVKGAKDAKFGADARATAPWDALLRLHEVSAGTSLGGKKGEKKDPYSLDHVLGSDKFTGIAFDSVSPYLSDDGKKAVESLKGFGVGQYGKDKDGNEYSKDSLGLFDLFYTAATDPGDILRPLDKVYDQLQTLGGMVTAANGLKPFLTKDGQKVVDALMALDFGKTDPTGTAQLFRDLLHGDPNNPKSTADVLDSFYQSLTSGAGLTAILKGAKPFMGKDGQKAVDAFGSLDLGGKDPTGMATLLYQVLHADPNDPNSSVTPFADFFDSAMSKEGVTAILNAAKPFLGKDGAKIIDGLQKAGFATDKDVIGLFPALQELYKGDKATVDILSDLMSNLGTVDGLAALLQGLTPFLPKEGAIAAQAMAEMLKGEWKDALGTLTKLLPKGAQAPAKAILALLKNDFQGFLMALAGEYLPKELQQTLGIFMKMGGFKGVLGLELPKPHDLVGLGDAGELGAGDAVLVSGCQGGPLAARVTDPVTSSQGPGTLIPPAAPCVLIGNQMAAREMDPAACAKGPDKVLKGEPTVLICGKPAARAGDPMAAGGAILKGLPTVMIGSAPVGPSSTAETSSGADAAASSASTAGSSGGATPGGEGASEEQAGKDGEEGGSADRSRKKRSDEYDLSKDGADKLRYPTGEEKEIVYTLQERSDDDRLTDPTPDEEADPLNTAGKVIGARGQIIGHGASAYEHETKAKQREAVENEAKAKNNLDEARSARDAAEADFESKKQKRAEINEKQNQAQREFGENYAQRNPEAKENLKEIERLEGEKPSDTSIAKSQENVKATTLNEGKASLNWFESSETLNSVNQRLKNIDSLKTIGKWTGVVGYGLATRDAWTADGSDGLSFDERLGVYWTAEAVPDLVTGVAVGVVAVYSAPVALTVGAVMTVGWMGYEMATGGDGEKFLRGTITEGLHLQKTVSRKIDDYKRKLVVDAYDYWTSGW